MLDAYMPRMDAVGCSLRNQITSTPTFDQADSLWGWCSPQVEHHSGGQGRYVRENSQKVPEIGEAPESDEGRTDLADAEGPVRGSLAGYRADAQRGRQPVGNHGIRLSVPRVSRQFLGRAATQPATKNEGLEGPVKEVMSPKSVSLAPNASRILPV